MFLNPPCTPQPEFRPSLLTQMPSGPRLSPVALGRNREAEPHPIRLLWVWAGGSSYQLPGANSPSPGIFC